MTPSQIFIEKNTLEYRRIFSRQIHLIHTILFPIFYNGWSIDTEWISIFSHL